MESFERIYLDLSKQPGKCRIAESGVGWKPSGGGDTWTLDKNEVGGAQWSRAAKGHELRIFSRTKGIIQLDGYDQEVSAANLFVLDQLWTHCSRISIASPKLSSSFMVSISKARSMHCGVGIGGRVNSESKSLHSTFRIGQPLNYHTLKYRTRI